jgi:hypothetical protein
MRDISQAADSAPTSDKRGMNSKNPPTKSTKNLFFIPALFHPLRISAVPPSDTPDDAMSGEAGPAPGWRVVADLKPRPAATVSLWTKGLTRVMGSDAPQNLDTLIGRTCLRGTQTRRPRCREHPDSGAKQTAGMRAKVGNDQGFVPRARVPVGLVHHPAGTSRATGQAMADIPRGGVCRSRTLRPVTLGPRVILGLNPRTRTEDRRRLARETHAAGIDAERGAGRSHIHYLDRLLLAPRPILGFNPRASFKPPGGRGV